MPDQDVTLYAQWTINQHQLTFDLNGASGTAPGAQSLNFGTLGIEAIAPQRAGYVFNGWNTASDGSGSTWDFTTTTMPDQDVTLYAQWTINQHQLVFDLNGANGTAPSAQSLSFGTLAIEPTAPQRAGYVFNGWNTASDGSGSTWDFTTTTMPDQDVTLYAQWTINQHQLTFDLNGASGTAPSAQSLNFGTLAIEPTAPQRAGYVFNGWNTASDGSGSTWDFTTTTMPDQDVTLYAQWDKLNVKQLNSVLHFDLNGGQGVAPENQLLMEGQKATKPVNPIREGFTFKGWNTIANRTGTNWDFDTTLMPANHVTLYAQWEQVVTPTPVENEKKLPETGLSSSNMMIGIGLMSLGLLAIPRQNKKSSK